jgi:hypothetical protein
MILLWMLHFKCQYAECHYAICHYTKCRGAKKRDESLKRNFFVFETGITHRVMTHGVLTEREGSVQLTSSLI